MDVAFRGGCCSDAFADILYSAFERCVFRAGSVEEKYEKEFVKKPTTSSELHLTGREFGARKEAPLRSTLDYGLRESQAESSCSRSDSRSETTSVMISIIVPGGHDLGGWVTVMNIPRADCSTFWQNYAIRFSCMQYSVTSLCGTSPAMTAPT